MREWRSGSQRKMVIVSPSLCHILSNTPSIFVSKNIDHASVMNEHVTVYTLLMERGFNSLPIANTSFGICKTVLFFHDTKYIYV